jgi:hypothetical protein
MRGGELPFNNDCTHITCNTERNNVLDKCIPIYNTFLFNGNILYSDKKHYVHFSNPTKKTYVLTDSLNLEEIDDVPTIENQEKFNVNDISDYFDKALIIDNIPCLFLFLDPTDVFNVIMSNPKKVIENIFRLNNNKFIGFSITFNIFNVALFTHTFFDILKVFFICFEMLEGKSKKIDANVVSESVKNIYQNKELLCKLYDLAVYKKEIFTMSNKNKDRDDFLKEPFGCDNPKYDSKQKNIIGLENHNYGQIYDTKYNSVINLLKQNVINIATELFNFSKNMDLLNYKYMFIMSILRYRLENKYITAGWSFSISKTVNQLYEHINKTGKITNLTNDQKRYFIKDNTFPNVYEFLFVTYKEKQYGNCMENVIFQFLKVLFWQNGKYDFEKMKSLIKLEYYEKLKSFFDNVVNERAEDFTLDWVKFIMFENKKIKYDFIQGDVELNSCFANLFLAYNELFDLKIYYNESNAIEFFNNLIHKLDLNIVEIHITKNISEDTIFLTARNGMTMNVSLLHHIHAQFKEVTAKSNSNNLIIINQIKGLQYLNKTEIHKDILTNIYYCGTLHQYILLHIIFGYDMINMNNAKKEYIKYIVSNMKSDEIDVSNQLMSDTNTKLREEICIDMLQSKLFSDKLWIDAVKYIKSEKFWGITSINDDILNSWKDINDNDNIGNSVWFFAVKYIKSEKFWENISTNKNVLNSWKDIKNNVGDSIWHFAVKYIKSEKFWENISTNKDVLNSWKDIKNNVGDSIWHFTVKYIKLEKFWENISINNNVLNSWEHFKNKNGISFWDYVVTYMRSEKFWENVSTNRNVLNSWNDLENNDGDLLWDSVMESIKLEKFWENISTNKDVLNSWKDIKNNYGDSMWYSAIKYIKSEKFWENISTNKDILNSWNIKNNRGNLMWSFVLGFLGGIKSEKFWENISTNKDVLNSWKDIKDNNGNSAWRFVIRDIKSEKFWENISTNKDVLNSWKDIKDNNGNSAWRFVIGSIKSEKFWENISTNKDVLISWKDIKDNDGYSMWNDILLYVKSEKFLENISRNKDVLNSWKDIKNNDGEVVWQFAVLYIRSDKFWENISTNRDVLNSWNIRNNGGHSIWSFSIPYIRSEKFWENISTNNDILNSWKDIKDNTGNSVWFFAVSYIKSKNFWNVVLPKYKELLIDLGIDVSGVQTGGALFYEKKYKKYMSKNNYIVGKKKIDNF